MFPAYAELHCLTNFSFQRGASHPEELVARAAEYGYAALAITDECSLAGVVGGLLIAHNLDVVIPALEGVTGMTLWNKEVYYINELPSKVLWSDVVSIVSVSFLLTLLAALYPSWRASKVNPAEALRYE